MPNATSGKVPVLECVSTSWRFFLDNWMRFAPAAVAVSVIPALSGLLLGGGAPAAVYTDLLISALASIVFTAAVTRYAVRGEFSGPAGLGFGADEMRLVGVFAAMTLVYVPFVLVFGVVLVVSIIRGSGLSPEEFEARTQTPEGTRQVLTDWMSKPIDPAVAVAAIVIGLVVLYLFVRLSLGNSATIGERKFVLFQTWGWSKGNVLHILAAIIITVLPIFLVNVVLTVVFAQISGTVAGFLVSEIVRGTVANLGNIPFIALTAHLYKGLRPPEFVARG